MTAPTITAFFCLILSPISCEEKITIDAHQIYFIQNGEVKTGSGYEYTVTLKKQEFAIQFFNKEYDLENEVLYAAQIVALSSKEELDAIQVGMQKSETACFAPGTGIAAERDGYSSLIINPTAHHYLTYKANEINRVRKVGEKNGVHKLVFDVKAITYNKVETKVSAAKINTIYLAILIDRNLDGIINKEDLTKVMLSLR